MVKRLLALAAVLLIAMAGTAAAQAYPPGGNTITANDTTVAPGDSITLTAQIFRPGSVVTFTMGSVVLGTATANSSGVASLTTTIPAGTAPGTHTIQATGTSSTGAPLTVVLSITVAAGGTGLPVTGSPSTAPMTQIAIGAVAAGGLLLLLANRRRSAKHPEHETAGV
jgi:hypothetical protein